jgi:multiple antibiotic resistance protein
MRFLNVQNDTIQIAGGIILFLICLKMIFPPSCDPSENLPHEAEPFIVPLAIPLIAGPSVLAAVMIYARQEKNWVMLCAILLAWAVSLLVLLLSSHLKQILGWRGILAIERLMGLILTLIAVQMFLSGLAAFTHANQ